MNVYDRIKKQASNRGWSLQDLADKAGLGTNSIYRWRTMNPKMDSLQAVADTLNVTVDYLLGNTENPSPTKSKPQDLADKDIVLSFEGKEIPPEDLETIRRFLRGGKDE